MITAFHWRSTNCWTIAFALLVLVSGGCEKSNPASDESAYEKADLFPVAPGRLWVFTAYELDTIANQKILSTVHRQVSYAVRTTTLSGKSAFLTIDSSYTPAGSFASADTSYLAIENGDLLQWEPWHGVWLAIFKKSAGLNTEYTVGEYQELVSPGVTVAVTMKGIVTPPEQVVAPIGTVQAYKVEINVTASFGGSTSTVQKLYLYFADGYGPVRLYTPAQRYSGSGSMENGSETLLVSKNF